MWPGGGYQVGIYDEVTGNNRCDQEVVTMWPGFWFNIGNTTVLMVEYQEVGDQVWPVVTLSELLMPVISCDQVTWDGQVWPVFTNSDQVLDLQNIWQYIGLG